MANIQKLTYPYFTDSTTPLNAANLNPIIAKLNEVIDQVNSGVSPTPTQTVATPTISISGTTATISCSTSGATIRYAIDGTPTESSGTIIANGGTVNLSSYNTQKTIRAIAYKSGMTTSQVGQATYTPAAQPDADATAIMARYSKSLTSAQQSAFNTFIVGLKNAGIYDKIVYMIVPVIANNLTEATQNALTGESAFNNSITSSNVSFANGGISPVVGGSKAQIKTTYGENNTQFENRNFHMSGYNVNVLTDTEYNEAQETLLSGGYVVTGKSLERGYKAGIRYFTAEGESNLIRFETSADVSVCKNKNHIVASFDTEKVIFSIHGTSDVNNQPVIGMQVYQPKRPRLGEYANSASDVYTDPTNTELPLGGASRCKYGFISWGFALTEAQCVAFNTCVETMMQAFV